MHVLHIRETGRLLRIRLGERRRAVISEIKIYDAAGSTMRLRKKEICHARQILWIICGPRGILNGFFMLSTTLTLN
jgi:hypothetical protein